MNERQHRILAAAAAAATMAVLVLGHIYIVFCSVVVQFMCSTKRHTEWAYARGRDEHQSNKWWQSCLRSGICIQYSYKLRIYIFFSVIAFFWLHSTRTAASFYLYRCVWVCIVCAYVCRLGFGIIIFIIIWFGLSKQFKFFFFCFSSSSSLLLLFVRSFALRLIWPLFLLPFRVIIMELKSSISSYWHYY